MYTWSIIRWNVWVVLRRPKGIQGYSKRTNGVIRAVFTMSSGAIVTWLYARTRSNLEKNFYHLVTGKNREYVEVDSDLRQWFDWGNVNHYTVPIYCSSLPYVRERPMDYSKAVLCLGIPCAGIEYWVYGNPHMVPIYRPSSQPYVKETPMDNSKEYHVLELLFRCL